MNPDPIEQWIWMHKNILEGKPLEEIAQLAYQAGYRWTAVRDFIEHLRPLYSRKETLNGQ